MPHLFQMHPLPGQAVLSLKRAAWSSAQLPQGNVILSLYIRLSHTDRLCAELKLVVPSSHNCQRHSHSVATGLCTFSPPRQRRIWQAIRCITDRHPLSPSLWGPVERRPRRLYSIGNRSFWPRAVFVRGADAPMRQRLRLFFLGVVPQPLPTSTNPARQQEDLKSELPSPSLFLNSIVKGSKGVWSVSPRLLGQQVLPPGPTFLDRSTYVRWL